MEVQLEATRRALELRIDDTKVERRAYDERIALLQEANQEQRELLARRDAERAEWLEEKAALLSSEADLRSSVGEMQDALSTMAVYRDEAERRVARFEEVRTLLAPLLEAGDLAMGVSDGHVVLELSTDALFGSSARQMSKRGRATIEAVAKALADVRGLRLEIVGHTDDGQPETDEVNSNLELTTVRALTVVETMRDAGYPLQRMVAAGHADHRPVDATADAINRRMEIRLVPDYSYLPGVPEIQALLDELRADGDDAAEAAE